MDLNSKSAQLLATLMAAPTTLVFDGLKSRRKPYPRKRPRSAINQTERDRRTTKKNAARRQRKRNRK